MWGRGDGDCGGFLQAIGRERSRTNIRLSFY